MLCWISESSVVEAAKEDLADKIEEHAVIVDVHELPAIEGHRPRLIQLLQNLISNAIKYKRSDKPTVSISAYQRDDAGDSWVLEVRENGIGIPPHRLHYVFQPIKRL